MSNSIRWTEDDVARYEASRKGAVKVEGRDKPQVQPKAFQIGRQPNKSELEYGQILQAEFPGAQIMYEGLTLRMQNGHKYTPDWIVIDPFGILCVEVKVRGKDGFRHGSYQRARLAFDQAKLDWPVFAFRWAEKSKGEWSK